MNKKLLKENFVKNVFIKTNKMFVWGANAPERLEYYLQRFGMLCYDNNELYPIRLGGKVNKFNEFIEFTQLFNGSKFLPLKEHVIFKSDSEGMGIFSIIEKWANFYSEGCITLENIIVQSRAMLNLVAKDEDTEASARRYIEKLKDGDCSVIAENSFFDGLKNFKIDHGNLKDFTDFLDYSVSRCLHELGLAGGWMLKRERMTQTEITYANDDLFPLIDNMYNERLKIADYLGTTVEIGSSWKDLDLDRKAEREILEYEKE